MSIARAAALVLAKELRLEFRSRELLTTTLVFVLMVIVLFSFSFDPTSEEARTIGPGLLWMAFLFAGSLMLNPSFAREQANDTLCALRLAPVEPFGILLGKILANLVFLLLTELLLVPVFAVLYNVALLPVLGRLSLVLFLGTLGLCVTGTAFSAISAQARMRELLLPLLLLPVLTPILIASVECTAGLFAEPAELRMNWLQVLVAFDIIFLAASYLLCDTLLEE
ncbi:MAG: heme exporter protein CcmB [Acidobacteria bacterium]|nr:heme exporter protein CcmB [Acidobacteriota bacterium]MCL5288880.1 heme exporter protein CcmB [Acidobacteriota bacterium]